MNEWMILGMCFFVAMASWILGYISHKPKKYDPVGTLHIYTGDPDGIYMTLESHVIPEYIMTQETVTLSVDVTDVSQK